MHERDRLSRRELEVLQLVADGKSNREVALDLCISINTVEQHLKHIFAKLCVKNRTQASRMFEKLRLQCQNTGKPL